ncbi:ParA family protein [Paenibacillus herberti]|uniref:AAA domain-containing protein n=1 Tax=Paenibacillus herberti TaxID=1619309 RepID=A0A229P5D3_9BACL|nr:ParA family protein [Paenibacillus herberti]OXM17300.1 hypothetical protein CGZ75_12050 [Paenibacillus herberti]
MARLELVVAAKEGEYVRRLSEYVRESPFGQRWRITSCTSGDSLRQYLKGGYPVHLLLVQPVLLMEAGALPCDMTAIALVRRKGEGDGLPELLQYQPLPELLACIEALHAGKPDRLRLHDSGTAILAVYDPVGGAGKTTCSLWLARLAGERGKRTLYLNLERYNTSELQLQEHGAAAHEGGLEALLYALKAGKPDLGEQIVRLRRYSRIMKTDYFGEAPGPEERTAMTGEDADLLLQTLAGCGMYDLIIVDLDSSLDETTAAIWSRSDAVCWLSEASPSSMKKSRLALKEAQRRYPEAVEAAKGRIVHVRSRCRQSEAFETVGAWRELTHDEEPLSYAFHLPHADALIQASDAPTAYIRAIGDMLERLEKGISSGGQG